MDSSDKDNAVFERARRSAAIRRPAQRRLDPIDGPRALGAKRLALQAQKQRKAAVDWHVGLLRTNGKDACVLVSADGTVAFAISRTASGLFLERRHCPPAGPRTSHALIFKNSSTFERWCSLEPACFDDPLLCHRLRRRAHELFAAHG